MIDLHKLFEEESLGAFQRMLRRALEGLQQAHREVREEQLRLLCFHLGPIETPATEVVLSDRDELVFDEHTLRVTRMGEIFDVPIGDVVALANRSGMLKRPDVMLQTAVAG